MSAGFRLAAFAAILIPAAAAAQPPAPHGSVPTVQAVRAASPITIDGRLDEEAWHRAPAATTFTQRDPEEGKPATEATELRVLYDDAALYVGVRMNDREAARVARQLSRRDTEAEADSFTLYLDPHHDHLSGAIFTVSAAGVQGDAVIYNDSSEDSSWDAVWDSAARIDAAGWTVELRIPYSQLRFTAAERHTFGINALRYIQRRKEYDWLVYAPKTENGLASRFGHLEGLEGISPRRTVEFRPYAVTRSEFIAPAVRGDPFNDGSRQFGGAGIDLKYRLSSNLSLDGTINPDFGQVEVDPAVVNLTAFETFFQEKRPFFIEGANIFDNFGRGGANSFWGFNRSEPLIFYSRRIGRAPQGGADGDFVDRPGATTILGAAKLTGRTRNGWSVGVLDAVTGRESARTISGDLQRRAPIEPPTNYFVGRLQREFGQRAAVGVLATAVDRQLTAAPLRDLLAAHAYVGGADGHYFFDAKRDWVVSGRLAGSHVSGSSAAVTRLEEAPQRYFQRPDAPHLHFDPSATALSGWTGSLNLNRNNGTHIVNAALWGVSPGFDSGDAGFNFNNDRGGAHFVYQLRHPKVDRFTRDRSFSLAKFYVWNFARELQADGMMSFNNVQWKNYWSTGFAVLLFRHVQDDRGTRGGPSMSNPGARDLMLDISSDSRKRVRVNLNAETATSTVGAFSRSVGAGVRIIPAASLEIFTGPRYTEQRNLAQYVGTTPDQSATATFGSRYLFSNLLQKEFSLETRVNYVLSPRTSFQLFLQPLVSAGDYFDFKELAQPRTFDFIHSSPDLPPARFGDPDFNFKSLRLNAIYRWEWKRGSALYAVWTEQRQDQAYPGHLAFGRDLHRVFAARPDDVFMIKIAYWFQK